MKPTQKLFTIVGSVAVVAAAGWTGYALFATPDSQAVTSQTAPASPSTPSSTTTQTSTSTSSPATTSSAYKDGTYTATTSYRVPHGGQNSVSATLTVTGGTVTNVTVNDDYTDGESQFYISGFESDISSSVKGQSLADVSVSRVGGASLTSEAFNAVLDTIRSDAKG